MSGNNGFRSKLWATPQYFDELNGRVDDVLGRLEGLAEQIAATWKLASERFDELDERFGALENRLQAMEEHLDQRIDQADQGINGNLNNKVDHGLFPELWALKDQLRTYDAQDKRLLWEATRRADETVAQAKARVFREMAPAEGVLRLLQKANITLLGALDEICEAHHLPYWITHGTLLGAVRHGGSIPWDDDIDVGMLRADLEKLQEILADDERYRITLVYDWHAKCRQFRFRYRDAALPCFVDIFVFDATESADPALSDQLEALRQAMLASMEADEALAPWAEQPYWEGGATDDPVAQAIEGYFDQLHTDAQALGIGTEGADAGVIWSGDNFSYHFAGRMPRWIFSTDALFPLDRVAYEDVTCNATREKAAILEELYGDIYALPGDILNHSHFFNGELEEAEAIAAPRHAETTSVAQDDCD